MIDRKCVELCYKYLDKVVRLCQQPKLSLKISQPYILDIIPDIYEKLQSIIAHYDDNYSVLFRIEYFQIYISTVIEKCKQTINLFKNSREMIFDANSDARSRLVKLSLIYSHLLKDLEALFPHNIFAAMDFRITKPDAARWWLSNFGHSAIVSWQLFKCSLLQTFCIDSESQLSALQTTIDLTCNDYVSIFEFDVFTRLFQPWCNILETWKALAILHPGYMAFMTYDQVKTVLKRYCTHPGPGTYIFRLSCTKLGQWAIGYITRELKVLQTIIQNKSLAQALVDGEKEGFYLYPNGKPSPMALLYHLTHNPLEVHLQVTKEQYQVYCEMGSSFELCKICDENNKDTQLEPCGHLICKHCLRNCQSTGNGRTCPFCRLEIKGIEDIIVDPYKPVSSPTNCVFQSTGSIAFCHREPLLHELTNTNIDALSCSVSNLCNKLNLTSNCVAIKPPPIPPRNLCLTPNTDEQECEPHTSCQNTISSVNHELGINVCSLTSNLHMKSQETTSDVSLSAALAQAHGCDDRTRLCPRENVSCMPQVHLQTSMLNINNAVNVNYAQLDLNKSVSSDEFEIPVSSEINTFKDKQRDIIITQSQSSYHSNCTFGSLPNDSQKTCSSKDNVSTGIYSLWMHWIVTNLNHSLWNP
ncbi:unnamed protein product [Heterobilharzia americana]|nr:unnamed protein product [Heterobilharzia americana]